MLTLLEALPVRLIVPLGGSQLREVDILVLVLLAVWGLAQLLPGSWSYCRAHVPVYLCVFVLVCPAAIGLAQGKPLAAVLRDGRTPLFFLAILPMLAVVGTYARMVRLIRFVAIVGGAAVLVGLTRWWTGAAPSPTEPYRFGIGSALGVIVWATLIAASTFCLETRPTGRRLCAVCFLAAASVFLFFANDIRSVYLGMAGAFGFIAVALWLRPRQLKPRHQVRRLGVAAMLLCAFGLGMLLTVNSWGFPARSILLSDLRLRRLYSLVDPTLGGTVLVGAGGTNRDDRLLGFTYGLELGSRNAGFGLGYGDNPFVDLDPQLTAILIQRNRLEGNPGNTIENMLFTHNSYGWAFGRLGLWFAIGYFAVIGVVCRRAWKAMLDAHSLTLRVVLLGTSAFVIYTLIAGFGGGGFFDYTGQGLITWLVAVTVLIRATQLVRSTGRAPAARADCRYSAMASTAGARRAAV